MPWRPASFNQKYGSRRQADRAYDQGRRQSDASLANARRIRSSAGWQRFRDWYKARHPLCSDPFGRHEADGVAVGAVDVHHVIPLAKSPDLAFVESNVASLCVACHNRIEAMVRDGKDGAAMLLFRARQADGEAPGAGQFLGKAPLHTGPAPTQEYAAVPPPGVAS